ncbi:class I adenylate-forming enzyme family protein [uncultured Tateyamaria sp.]|uniref:class I adenylate-forming enzyme family protein n=1 Tax=uncultured Tateyamaria sp. TaxID=455651 RepID=UPI002632847D|nr:AMP-binding protein [uncultured Tateyamaria sp.]
MKLHHGTPPDGTVRDWLDARAQSGGTAIVFPETGGTLSWQQLQAEAARIALDLTAQGVNKGDSVAVMHPNGRDGVIALYAALYGGFRATMINLAAGPDAIAYALEHSEARVAFVHPDQRDVFDQAKPAHLNTYVPTSSTSQVDLHPLQASDDALLMYTSGTTGRPKGVVHTHASLLAGGWTVTVAHHLTERDRGFCVLPIYHINGQCVTVMGSLVSGGSLAMVSRFSASQFWQQAATGEVTWFSVVPTIISHVLHAKGDPAPALRSRIRFGRSASSALAVETQTAFQNRFGIPIVETMGLTETAAQILSNPLDPARHKIGSSGIAYGNEARIADETGTPTPTDVEGEIQVRGPNVMKGYLKNPDATANAFAGAWFRTGDLGRMDADGYVYVTGRLKELIIKGGENIAPREIDEALYQHPDVMEAAAFARPCPQYGERVEAAVRLRPGSSATPDDLVALCTTRVGTFKAPDCVHILDELPKGPSGKIQRLYLNEMLYGKP